MTQPLISVFLTEEGNVAVKKDERLLVFSFDHLEEVLELPKRVKALEEANE